MKSCVWFLKVCWFIRLALGFIPARVVQTDNTVALTQGTPIRKSFTLGASLLDALKADPAFSTFAQLLEGVPDLKTLLGTEDIGQGDGNIFTVFAPTNDAFKKLSKDQAFKLGKKENLPVLRKLVRYHFHEDILEKQDILNMREMSTLALLPVTVNLVEAGKDFRLNEARVVRELPICSNGKVFEVDSLISPFVLFRFLV